MKLKKKTKKQRNKHFGVAMQKRTLKLFVNELLIKKIIFCNIIVNGKFRKFPWSCRGGLALQYRILLQYQHLLSPQLYLPAYDVNTQTLCPFRPSSREKVYLQKSHIRPKLRQTTIKSTTKLADSFGISKVHHDENILLPCNTSFDPSILKMQFGKLVDVQTS